MTSQPLPEIQDHPSLSTLARTTAIALVVAGVILVTAVLPAEYGIDPVGTGRWLGLTEIAAPPLDPVELTRAEGAALKPTVNGPIGEYPGQFKVDVYEVVLQPYEYVEYKYQLEQSATMAYSWTASAPVLQDFHGERSGGGENGAPAEVSFDKRDRNAADGSFTAPFAGIHGWYWENPGGEPVTVRLTTSGFYTAAVEIRSDRTRTARTLRTIDTLMPVGRGAGMADRP
jgi:hypothetical protein